MSRFKAGTELTGPWARRTRAGGLALATLAAAIVMAQGQAQAQALEPAGSLVGAAETSTSSVAPPSVEQGRELFARHCTRCHGGDARGTGSAPDLAVRIRGMSESGFVSAVLQRYRWSLPASESGGESSGFEAMVRGILSRQTQGDPAAMPAWESEPTVKQGVRDLYAFLNSVQAAGGAGR